MAKIDLKRAKEFRNPANLVKPKLVKAIVKPKPYLTWDKYQKFSTQAGREIADCTCQFGFQQDTFGTATFVSTNGIHGILSAHHFFMEHTAQLRRWCWRIAKWTAYGL